MKRKKEEAERKERRKRCLRGWSIIAFGQLLGSDGSAAATGRKSSGVLAATEISTAMMRFLLRSRNLREEIFKAQAKEKEMEHEKAVREEIFQKEQLLLTAKEKELASLQARYNELDTKMKEFRDLHISKVDLDKCFVAFLFRVLQTGGMANIVAKINETAKNMVATVLQLPASRGWRTKNQLMPSGLSSS
ncbi:OLC1v1025060C3 [Oldenlandia corymbosa var. corymbosa]|uniref:OLC1v1025060C3 n=1 Tax=Oldenlandia corymbosa var. corymbosa TaxID=529605 RepID=A0AAV1C3U3_OLDCO|nr:OLC1v1025060C3 [Oldenlandia corymbosa var. corymbosa]